MKRLVVGFLVGLVAVGVGVAWYFLAETERVAERVAESERVAERQDPTWDFPSGDTTPEHLAKVLGSYELYQKLRDSPLHMLINVWDEEEGRMVDKGTMRIIYGTDIRGQKIDWAVDIHMQGEVIEIKGRVITIAHEGETISLYMPEWVGITAYYIIETVIEDGEPRNTWGFKKLKLEDIKVGSWLPTIYVLMRANQQPEVRGISINVATP